MGKLRDCHGVGTLRRGKVELSVERLLSPSSSIPYFTTYIWPPNLRNICRVERRLSNGRPLVAVVDIDEPSRTRLSGWIVLGGFARYYSAGIPQPDWKFFVSILSATKQKDRS